MRRIQTNIDVNSDSFRDNRAHNLKLAAELALRTARLSRVSRNSRYFDQRRC